MAWDPKKFVVYDKVCDECLFSKNKIVTDESMKRVLADSSMTHFVCHKASEVGEDVACRGFFDRDLSPMVRLAKELMVVEFVPLPDDQS